MSCLEQTWSGKLESSLKYPDWIPVRSPGLEFYADEIRSGVPFALARYGEGEWRTIHPDQKVKKQHVYSEWRDEEAQERLAWTLIDYHHHPRYWPAIWHQRAYANGLRLEQVKAWLKERDLDIPWHDGRLWRRAVENDRVGVIARAMREQELPLVFVGPEKIKGVEEHFEIDTFITVHYTHAYHDIPEIKERILELGPSLISFSVGGTAKILIHELFPDIGEQSYLIDFGALWEGLCGHKVRPYHKTLNKGRIRRNWG